MSAARPGASLEHELNRLSMPSTSPPRKTLQHTLTTLLAFRQHASRLGCHQSCAFCITIKTLYEALRIFGEAGDGVGGVSSSI